VLPYDEAGSGQAVVLIHAGVADRSMWREHFDWLANAGFRVVAVDLPGFGDAAVAEGLTAPWDEVLQTMRTLEVGPAALIGNSFGAAVALRMAAIAPVAVSALVLISPPPLVLDPSPALRLAWEAEETALERGDIDGAVAAVVDAWMQPDASEALRERVASMQRCAFELQAAAGDAREAPDPLEQHPEVLAELQIPALVAAGEDDMPDFRDAAEQLAEALPLGRHTVIGGAGHLAPLEAPDRFKALVLDFLASAATRTRDCQLDIGRT
jgi:pimeloyl-ACP methyl ester carboxylesterase